MSQGHVSVKGSVWSRDYKGMDSYRMGKFF